MYQARRKHNPYRRKALQEATLELANQTMDEALVDVRKDDIEIVKKVLQQVYDNLNP